MSLAREQKRALRFLQGIALEGEFVEDPESGEIEVCPRFVPVWSKEAQDFMTTSASPARWKRRLPSLKLIGDLLLWGFAGAGAGLFVVIAIRFITKNH